MQLSVIILNYNVCYFLEQCVQSVQNALEQIDSEIIVVDNHSSDDSCAMIKQRFPNVKLIENTENLGFPKGNNIGVSIAKGNYICILNPDTIVAEDTFEKIVSATADKSFLEMTENVGIVGVKLIDGTGNFLPESKRGVPTPWVAFTKMTQLYAIFPKTSIFNRYYAQHLTQNETGKVDILVGAFMVMKRELYLEVGGFDENCFMYSDDIDLSYMILKKGKSNYYFHDTTVIHYKGESTIRDGVYMKRFQEAMHFFYKKHFKVSILFSVVMQLGILFFSVIKKFQATTKSKTVPSNYILISDNENYRKKLEVQLNKKVIIQDHINSFPFSSGSEIIFDQNYLEIKTIIKCMETFKDKGFTFKIGSKSFDFIIGSNSSFDRGEIIKIPNL